MNPRHSLIARALLPAAALASCADAARAVDLHPGDIVIVDTGSFSDPSTAKVVRIDPVTGVHTTISVGGLLTRGIADVSEEADGRLLVSDATGGLIRIDPATGAQTLVSIGGGPHGVFFRDPVSAIMLASHGAVGLSVERADLTTGVRTPIYSSSVLGSAQKFDVDAVGNAYIATWLTSSTGQLVKTNIDTGVTSVLASGGFLRQPCGVMLLPNGDILTSVFSPSNAEDGLVRINPITGAQTAFSLGGLMSLPYDLALSPNGDIIVADLSTRIIRVNPITGEQSLITQSGGLVMVRGMTIVSVPAPSAAAPFALLALCAVRRRRI